MITALFVYIFFGCLLAFLFICSMEEMKEKSYIYAPELVKLFFLFFLVIAWPAVIIGGVFGSLGDSK